MLVVTGYLKYKMVWKYTFYIRIYCSTGKTNPKVDLVTFLVFFQGKIVR